MSCEAFAASSLRYYATVRAFEIVSEASRKLPAAVRDRHPHLPWRNIQDAGNVDRHEYDNVAERRVWQTVLHSLPALLEAVTAELDALERNSSLPEG